MNRCTLPTRGTAVGFVARQAGATSVPRKLEELKLPLAQIEQLRMLLLADRRDQVKNPRFDVRVTFLC